VSRITNGRFGMGRCRHLAVSILLLGVVGGAVSAIAANTPVHAADLAGDFNLQVTPSPLVATVKPGVKSQLELKVHNSGDASEDLKIEPRAFTLGKDSTDVKLQEIVPAGVAGWISFSQPKFTLQPGQWQTETITLNVPKDAGFSYSFALVISRQSLPKNNGGTRVIAGSLAVFTLINVDRPGATSNLQVSSFSVSKHVYEYLPSSFSVRLHNIGNTIAQPYGNIFVQRSANTATPLATLPVNETRGYILPGTERTITASWTDGFPAYKTTTSANGKTQQKLIWNWGDLSKLRIGRYTAHLVAVYNQAGHDVPIEGTVTFWVIPWKILLGLLVVVLLLLLALFVLVRAVVRFVRRKLNKQSKNPPPTPEAPQA
jgi:hypothetical protein